MLLGEIAKRLGLDLEGDASIDIRGLAPVDAAEAGDLCFVAAPRYRALLRNSGASAVILAPGEDAHGKAVLRSRQPYGAFVQALALFDERPRAAAGIHKTAVIAPSAQVGERASIGAYCVIGERVVLGDDAQIHPHVVLYPDARIGCRFTAHSGAVVREAVLIGDDVVLQPGAVVGGDGFGFLPRGKDVPLPIPQIGTVRLEDHVELGSNTTVDRATVGATHLGRGVKLDNLVMVGHGSRIGAGSMLAGQTGMAGSTQLGERVMSGGQAGFGGHLSVGDDVRVAAQGGVVQDTPGPGDVGGTPAVSLASWRRVVLSLQKLPELLKRVRRLEQKLGLRDSPEGPKDS